MPQIPVFLGNEDYIKFLKMDQEERSRIRKVGVKAMSEEINQTVKVNGGE